MKIGYILKTFPVLSQTFVLNEMRTLEALGVPIEIFSVLLPDPEDTKQQQDGGGRLTERTIYWQREREPRWKVGRANAALLAQSGHRAYARARQAIEEAQILQGQRAFARFAAWAYELRRRGVTHLHAHFATEGAVVARAFAALTGSPYSVTVHAYDLFLYPDTLSAVLPDAAFIVTVSRYNKDYILGRCPEIDPARIHVLHPWVDLEQFQPVSLPEGEPLRILSVGRPVEKKGHAYLIEACQLLQEQGVDFTCDIIGEGPLREKLETRIAEHDLQKRVRLLGARPHAVVREALSECNVFALACVIAEDGDRDGMPVSLAEAMACGVPVVSTDIVGLPELIQNGAGLLVLPRDAASLAQALRRISEMSPAERSAMGRSGRAVIEADFSLRRGVEELAALFESYQQPLDTSNWSSEQSS